MKFKAAVLHKVGGPLTIEDVESGPLKPSDVLVRIHASGLCHTDLEVIQGSLGYPLPIILGHEGAGVVEAVGADVRQVKQGDHVICSWNPHCGHCFYCERDQPILCEVFTATQPKGQLMDGTTRYKGNGGPVHHFSVVSSHAQYCVVPESGAIPVPKAIPFDRACLIGCGVMTGFGAATRMAPVAYGATAVVLGCGAVGLNAIQGARMIGAGRVVAVDISAKKLEMARIFGATDVIDLTRDDPIAAIKGMTAGRGADFVFEAAGHEKVFALSAEITRPGGHLVFLGKVNVDKPVAFRWGALMGEKRIVRSSYGGARPRRDFPLLAQSYLDGKLKLDELITARLPLERINDGFAAMTRGEGIRTVLMLA
jgi:S-(hydroxymethyl)glutathione dehydrogenase/alcohol dehydrogenase